MEAISSLSSERLGLLGVDLQGWLAPEHNRNRYLPNKVRSDFYLHASVKTSRVDVEGCLAQT